MSVRLFVTIDTEEDLWKEYSTTDNPVHNIDRLPSLQALFNRYGIIPTYLVNYPVSTDDRATRVILGLINSGNCEIGTHCHPWNTPPFEDEITERNTMMCNLGISLLRKKLANLHNVIRQNLHIEATSFRAGRWAFGTNVAKCIGELGYKVDSSITPFTDWSSKYGQDFSDAPPSCYWLDNTLALNTHSPNRILEVPPTIGFNQKNMRICGQVRSLITKSHLHRLRILGFLNALRLVNYRWLSPETNTGHGMIRLAQAFIDSGHQFLNMFFHSTSLLPGAGPFVRTETDLAHFLAKIETFLEYANREKFTSLSLTQALSAKNGLFNHD